MSAEALSGSRLDTAPAASGLEEEKDDDLRAYRIMRGVEWAGMHLPRSVGLRAAEGYMTLHFRRHAGQRAVVARNLSRVLGHPPDSTLVQRATRECFLLYGRYWYETFALRTMTVEEVERRCTVDGLEHLDRATDAGKGIVMTLPHMGNWDAAGHWLCVRGYRMTAVAEQLASRRVFELFLRHRRALGMNIVSLSEQHVGRTLVGLLAENHAVTLVADRDLTGRGVDVEMFGDVRKLPAGPAFLSLATGSPLSVCAVFTTAEGWHVKIGPPVEIERSGETRKDVESLTRVIAGGFERYICEAPTDWHMFQPAWPDDERWAADASVPDMG
ncbi:MAG: phosphatidylinositol mannoside acyltransferase [Actinobacteria bacterium]|nr:phosphatidylinositol mannoside acyltransferase [Actinomycetota bacterium]